MACPLFSPETASDGYLNGHCSAAPDEAIPADKLRLYCNRGYARSVCPRAGDTEADALQLLIKADAEGVLQIAWSLERDHHPVAVGTVTITGGSIPATPLEAQALALAKSYLEEKQTNP